VFGQAAVYYAALCHFFIFFLYLFVDFCIRVGIPLKYPLNLFKTLLKKKKKKKKKNNKKKKKKAKIIFIKIYFYF